MPRTPGRPCWHSQETFLLADTLEEFWIGWNAAISGSVGIAWRHPHACDRGEWLSRADLAMYAAKAAGKARYAVADITGSCAVPADAV